MKTVYLVLVLSLLVTEVVGLLTACWVTSKRCPAVCPPGYKSCPLNKSKCYSGTILNCAFLPPTQCYIERWNKFRNNWLCTAT